jgi:hypothetical protein
MLEAIRWRTNAGGEVRRTIRHLFLFIGATQAGTRNCAWLLRRVGRHEQGRCSVLRLNDDLRGETRDRDLRSQAAPSEPPAEDRSAAPS